MAQSSWRTELPKQPAKVSCLPQSSAFSGLDPAVVRVLQFSEFLSFGCIQDLSGCLGMGLRCLIPFSFPFSGSSGTLSPPADTSLGWLIDNVAVMVIFFCSGLSLNAAEVCQNYCLHCEATVSLFVCQVSSEAVLWGASRGRSSRRLRVKSVSTCWFRVSWSQLWSFIRMFRLHISFFCRVHLLDSAGLLLADPCTPPCDHFDFRVWVIRFLLDWSITLLFISVCVGLPSGAVVPRMQATASW